MQPATTAPRHHAKPQPGGTSRYPQRFEDPAAIYLTGAVGDGSADDTAAIQAAIDRVVLHTIRGILFIPSGRYRLTAALKVWPGIRLIGFGPTRPALVLGDATPGYQDDPAYLVHFTGNTPGYQGNGAGFTFQPGFDRPAAIDFTGPFIDATPGTFYSALSNIDFAIGDGNPGAAAVRSTYAQHCFIAFCDFHLGSAFAGIHDGGNVCHDVRFFGGQHAIVTTTPSPGWQFVLVDAEFTGQSRAAICTERAGLTLIRPVFRDLPTAIAMHAGRGEQLCIRDGWLEDISGPAVLIGNEHSSRNQINLLGLTCRDVPILARYQGSGADVHGASGIYRVVDFAHGIHLYAGGVTEDELVASRRLEMVQLDKLPPPVPSDLPVLPDQAGWINVRSVGVVGDGIADDSEALQRAIDSHRCLYLPCGAYRISRTIVLRPDSVLVGLHAGATRIFLADNTPAFRGVGAPIAMIEAPSGGCPAMLGLGIYTGAINPRALAVKWMAGKDSFMNDVRFLGGHGTAQLSGAPEALYLHNRSADPDPQRLWDAQYPSLWITDGGGGVFLDIWTPSPFAQSGLLISRTSTPGRIYAMSVEHHVRNEVRLEDVANWEIYALQLEEERGESRQCLPLELVRCRNVTLANLFIYRVISSDLPQPCAVRTDGVQGLRFRGFHLWTNSKADFDDAIVDTSGGRRLRANEFATLTLDDRTPTSTATAHPGLRQIASGFGRLAGGAVDGAGRFYAVDLQRQQILRWSLPDARTELIADHPLQPVNLAVSTCGLVLVVSYTGAIYELDPDHPDRPIRVLTPRPPAMLGSAHCVLPVNAYSTPFLRERPCQAQVVSSDGSLVIPLAADFLAGTLSWGVKAHDLLRAYGLQIIAPGAPVHISSEYEGATYQAELDVCGNPVNGRLFAQHGGAAVAVGADGRIYIAEGHIFVYHPDGRLDEVIRTPHRPLGLVFGGPERRTLFIISAHELHGVQR